MFLSDILNQVNQVFVSLDATSIPNYLIFFIFALVGILIGKYTSVILGVIIKNFIPGTGQKIINNFLEPLKEPFQFAGTCLLISLSSAWLIDYQQFYKFFHPLIVFSVVVSLAWLASRVFRQLIRIYGVKIISKSGLENELLLVFETIANVVIGFIALVSYAQSQKFPLTGLLAGVSIGGIAISFSASKTLEQFFGTIVLFLDRPFIPGDYIRYSLGSGEIYARVESIGLRSSKVRVAATGTLYIVPNNKLADVAIENITRGKKVMVLLY
ncbi:mechanosensitive ion channel family protein [Dapis sp. BLCC M126]|uniref:mechanosensitive ion channel family protein n=1 Tax=Dapis sp. BLCC M126 TaxID=3400189 RepID=UPI003CEAB143